MARSSAALIMVLALAAPAAAADTDEPPKPATCVRVETEARYRNYGYDHLVKLHSECDKAATCVVKTDVNPKEITVEVAAKEDKVVITFTGSPSRAFQADVSCTEHD